MAEETSNYEKMKTFIMALLDEFYPECGDIDGGTFQDLAEKHGILIPEIKYQPCGEFCKCNEVVYDEEWQDGVTCYHAAEWLSRAVEQSVQPTDGTLSAKSGLLPADNIPVFNPDLGKTISG